ncbi:hypothetical protein ACU686_26030 [Yinghuangia aomiensis]
MPAKKSTKVVVGGVAAAAMVLVSGCSTPAKAKKVPDDLCAVMTAPPLTQFLGGGTPQHRAKNDKLTARADCEISAEAEDVEVALEVDLERHGGTKKHKASYWSQRAYKSTKDSHTWTYRCSNPPASPRLGKDSFECRSDGRLEITVRKDKDVLTLVLTGPGRPSRTRSRCCGGTRTRSSRCCSRQASGPERGVRVVCRHI